MLQKLQKHHLPRLQNCHTKNCYQSRNPTEIMGDGGLLPFGGDMNLSIINFNLEPTTPPVSAVAQSDCSFDEPTSQNCSPISVSLTKDVLRKKIRTLNQKLHRKDKNIMQLRDVVSSLKERNNKF